jgi:hypothetical protein
MPYRKVYEKCLIKFSGFYVRSSIFSLFTLQLIHHKQNSEFQKKTNMSQETSTINQVHSPPPPPYTPQSCDVSMTPHAPYPLPGQNRKVALQLLKPTLETYNITDLSIVAQIRQLETYHIVLVIDNSCTMLELFDDEIDEKDAWNVIPTKWEYCSEMANAIASISVLLDSEKIEVYETYGHDKIKSFDINSTGKSKVFNFCQPSVNYQDRNPVTNILETIKEKNKMKKNDCVHFFRLFSNYFNR